MSVLSIRSCSIDLRDRLLSFPGKGSYRKKDKMLGADFCNRQKDIRLCSWREQLHEQQEIQERQRSSFWFSIIKKACRFVLKPHPSSKSWGKMALSDADKKSFLWQRALFKEGKSPRTIADSLRMRLHLLNVCQERKSAHKNAYDIIVMTCTVSPAAGMTLTIITLCRLT